MTKRPTRSHAKLEKLVTLWTAYTVADQTDPGTFEAANRLIRLQNELLDHCIECGMDREASEFEFAARVASRYLCAA